MPGSRNHPRVAAHVTDVAAWLREQGLELYAPAFAEQQIDGALLGSLTEAELKELGVTTLGHRKRLLLAIAALDADRRPTLAWGGRR